MPDYDRNLISDLLAEHDMDERYFVRNLKAMIDRGGQNTAVGLKMLGDLKGLGQKQVQVNVGILDSIGMECLSRSVQDNRRLGVTVQQAEVVSD